MHACKRSFKLIGSMYCEFKVHVKQIIELPICPQPFQRLSDFWGSFNGKQVSIHNFFCYFQPERLLVFFVRSKMVQGSLGLPVFASESALRGPQGEQGPFQRPFWTFCNTCNTQSQRAACIEFKKRYGKWIVMLKDIMAPNGPLIFIIFIF